MLSLPHIGWWWAAPLALGGLTTWQRRRWAAAGTAIRAGTTAIGAGIRAATTGTEAATRAATTGTEAGTEARPAKQWRQHFALIFAFWLGAYGFGLIWLTDLTVPGWATATLIEALIMTLPLALALGASNVGFADATAGALRRQGTSVVALASALMLGEAIRWAFPFGGVPLSSLALGAVNSPWAPLARLGGPLLLVGATAILAATFDAALGIWLGRKHRLLALSAGLTVATVFVPLIFVALISLAGAIAPQGNAIGELEVAVLQSGGELGQSGRTDDVFDKHIAVTRQHAGELASVDLLVWSESSLASDGPLEDSPELERLQALANEVGTTIIANFYERTVGVTPPRFRNATVAVAPTSAVAPTRDAGGYLGRYDKVHLVPFGEYIPFRSAIDGFADLSLVSRDAIAGTEPGLLSSPFGPLAVVSSFEIYFPGSVRSGVNEGGAIVVNPTLSSSYRTDWVPAQSLASARLRAIESGRWVLQSSTTGYSAVVDPAGNVLGRTELGEADVVIATAELRSGRTVAYLLSTWPLVLAALLAFVLVTLLAFGYALRPGQTS